MALEIHLSAPSPIASPTLSSESEIDSATSSDVFFLDDGRTEAERRQWFDDGLRAHFLKRQKEAHTWPILHRDQPPLKELEKQASTRENENHMSPIASCSYFKTSDAVSMERPMGRAWGLFEDTSDEEELKDMLQPTPTSSVSDHANSLPSPDQQTLDHIDTPNLPADDENEEDARSFTFSLPSEIAYLGRSRPALLEEEDYLANRDPEKQSPPTPTLPAVSAANDVLFKVMAVIVLGEVVLRGQSLWFRVLRDFIMPVALFGRACKALAHGWLTLSRYSEQEKLMKRREYDLACLFITIEALGFILFEWLMPIAPKA